MFAKLFLITAFLLISSSFEFSNARYIRMVKLDIFGPQTLNTFLCRQECFSEILHRYRFTGSPLQTARCNKNSDCSTCWDSCAVLNASKPETIEAICSNQKFCKKGCRVACENYSTSKNYALYRMILKPRFNRRVVQGKTNISL